MSTIKVKSVKSQFNGYDPKPAINGQIIGVRDPHNPVKIGRIIAALGFKLGETMNVSTEPQLSTTGSSYYDRLARGVKKLTFVRFAEGMNCAIYKYGRATVSLCVGGLKHELKVNVVPAVLYVWR